ncbi:hypothetical protein SAMN05421821_106100 [Mucilaginibacter lappiensis]|uniref:Uncharacterized protein n=1 Tax=Mucilaginibacter lappiensis TaxID=354630 RepID=A0ABR6PKZ6_9SPHI|nr:hypothetical protein [Mucilaginibacter lappiensis]SIR29443.1 hypothetical protein SAMN05421821_106100 [Mucilaginibacter lappiensis]
MIFLKFIIHYNLRTYKQSSIPDLPAILKIKECRKETDLDTTSGQIV